MRCKRLPSKSIKVNKLLPNLPEEIIIEILIRLPRNSVALWKCVSKRWYTLISDPNFLTRFLCLQNELKTPIQSGMIFTDYNSSKYYSLTTILSELPKSVKHSLEEREGRCTVLATYNDLALCFRETHYNICNLHTMQQVALPPTPPCRDDLDVAAVGFICEPYYKEEDSPSRSIILNVEYRCRVVLIYKCAEDSLHFCMDVFFSETGEWREFSVLCPRRARKYCSFDNGAEMNSYNNSGGIAYSGKLYWLGEGGIMELDPLAFDSNTSYELSYPYCRFIRFQVFGNHKMGKTRLCVCRGCMCLMSCQGENFVICKLESRDDDQLARGKSGNWRFKLFHWSWITGNPWLLSLDSFDEDCFYVISSSGYFGKDNMRTGKTKYDHSVKRCNGAGSWELFGAFQFVLPWWPTPVPNIKQPVPHGIDIFCNLLLDP